MPRPLQRGEIESFLRRTVETLRQIEGSDQFQDEAAASETITDVEALLTELLRTEFRVNM